MMRLLTALVLGFCLAACSSPTAPTTTVATVAPPPSSAPPPSIPGQSFSVNPVSVAFGNQIVNTTSAPRAVMVTNTGTMPQPVRSRINGIQRQWDGFAATDNCPTMLAVGASCTLNVTFTPSYSGLWGGYLVIDGINDEQGIVGVGGTGIF